MDREPAKGPPRTDQPIAVADPVSAVDQVVDAARVDAALVDAGRLAGQGSAPAIGRGRLRAVTTLMAVMAGLGSLSISLYAPSLPAIATDLGSSEGLAEITLTVFLVGFACAQLLYGPLSDRFGRRPVLLGGTVLYVLGGGACWFAPTIGMLIAARFLQALGACVGQSVGRAVIRDLYDRGRLVSVMALLSSAAAGASSLGPSFGGFVEVYLGWRANFVLLTLLGALLVLALLLILPETNHSRPLALQLRHILANFRQVLGSRQFVGYMLVGSGIFAGYYSFVATAPFLFIEGLGLRPDRYGLVAVVPTLTYVVSALVAARLGRVWPVERTILVGLGIATFGVLGMLLPAAAGSFGVPQIIGGMIVFAVGMGFVYAASVAGGMAPFPGLAGSASALIGFVQMTTGAAATLLIGQFRTPSALPLTLAMAGFLLLAMLGYGLAARRRR